MGCFSSKTKDDKEEEKKGTEPEAPEDDVPAEEVAPKTKDIDAPSDHSRKNFYGKYEEPTVGSAEDDGKIEFEKLDPSQYIDDAEIEGAKPKVDNKVESKDSVLKRVHDNHGSFSPEERKEITAFLNRIEEIATKQGVFGELGR